ncbi:hypothetical protein FCM35_KLT08640 [Carex littledalei]|uniref:C2H2-type domain-containing protein n=1 Tax=Carex littledalei TaxID=544730 RepID=A0A833VGS1_9POAL|nr:hypothetical protein FCM35_KLT08640 [Carex littledalei]
MDNNPFNENNNTNSGYVPSPPNVSPLYEAILPFYQPQNNYPPAYPPAYPPVYSPVCPAVYSPVPLETHQGYYTPTGVNWYNPPYVLESADLVPVTNLPSNYLMNNSTGDTSVNTDHTNYLMNNFTGDTSVNTDHSSFIINFEQSSGGEKQDLHKQVFQCEKCPSKFYSKHAFGGHMSAHSKQAKKFNNVSQIMMAATGQSMSGASISGMNEGSNSSAAAASKKRGRKKGKNVVTDEPNARKTVN